ncbi:MAG TPA: NTP transferase domain-containing protein [Acidobacteriota bacterium]|nr:NTP transferase domain-containing protein [Acidobacteriota bacterium]
MTNRYAQMNCYVLAGGRSNIRDDFKVDGELTRLEKGFRRYAAVFEKVCLVLKKQQAREGYLNYPHVCDSHPEHAAVAGLVAALRDADSEAVFIGSADIADFPLELVVRLMRSYRGEPFLGYQDARSSQGRYQPWFGIYRREFAARLEGVLDGREPDIAHLLAREGRFLPVPNHAAAGSLCMN